VAKSPVSATPLLLRAQYYYNTGWAKRGNNAAAKTDPERMTAFADIMAKALTDINEAIRIDDSNPFSFCLKLLILQGNGLTQIFVDTFEEAIKKHASYYRLYEIALSTLQPRWRGSIPAMYGFVQKYADNAPQFSPLKLLYLSLYQHLLSTASVDCAASGGDQEKTEKCVASFMGKVVIGDLEQHVLAALQLYDQTDKYQFGLALKKIVSNMLRTTSGDTYSGAILQLAATSMHSDTQLSQDNPDRHNDYIIDELVAESWNQKRFYQNEMTKYKEVLVDAQLQQFPSDEEKQLALGSIYEYLANASNQQHDHISAIAYERATTIIGQKME
jgi:hypothetical protein